MPEVVSAGETMALLVPSGPGRLRHAAQLELRIGGAESTVAIALARLGLSAGWVSWLGDDELGELVCSRVRAEGVDVSQVRRVDAPTGLYLREQVAGSVRVYYYRRHSAASAMGPRAFHPGYLDGAKFLHLSGITPALSKSCSAFTRWAVAEAKDRGVKVSFDVNYRSKLWSKEEARGFIDDLLPRTDLLFVSDDEARVLWQEEGETLLATLAAQGPKEVLLKKGAEGCLASLEGELFSQPAYKVTAVDPIGAGDAFAAGYLAAKLWGLAPERRLKAASALGAYSVMSPGDYEGLPGKDELWAFIDGKGSLGR